MKYNKLYGNRDKYNAFKTLILRVEAIDKDAAQFMRTEASSVCNFAYSGDIDGFVFWGDTPQGHQYWWDIETALEARNV
jgi:hypothetical protein